MLSEVLLCVIVLSDVMHCDECYAVYQMQYCLLGKCLLANGLLAECLSAKCRLARLFLSLCVFSKCLSTKICWPYIN